MKASLQLIKDQAWRSIERSPSWACLDATHTQRCSQAVPAGTELPRYKTTATSWTQTGAPEPGAMSSWACQVCPASTAQLLHCSSGLNHNGSKPSSAQGPAPPRALPGCGRCALHTMASTGLSQFSASGSLESPLQLVDYRQLFLWLSGHQTTWNLK